MTKDQTCTIPLLFPHTYTHTPIHHRRSLLQLVVESKNLIHFLNDASFNKNLHFFFQAEQTSHLLGMFVIYKVYDSHEYSKKSRSTYLYTGVISNICPGKFCKALKKAPVMQSFFSKVVGQPESLDQIDLRKIQK